MQAPLRIYWRRKVHLSTVYADWYLIVLGSIPNGAGTMV